MRRIVPILLVLAACSHQSRTGSPSPLSVSFKNPNLELCEGMHGHFIAVTQWTYTTEKPPEGPPEITWRTLAPGIAEVDSEGEVTALSPGKAIIEAMVRLGGRTGVARGEVNVKAGTLDTSATGEADSVVCR